MAGHYMVVQGTEADPAHLDVSLHSWNSTRTPASDRDRTRSTTPPVGSAGSSHRERG
ncbi:hypothetical protein ACFYXF_47720 [Streptomyces sp. NPDC002680]|uniref:hypothetical protein n=1 Tax=Streptomyces sp. NPDC002680 TaxID=3364659 RepID=UPI003682BAF5